MPFLAHAAAHVLSSPALQRQCLGDMHIEEAASCIVADDDKHINKATVQIGARKVHSPPGRLFWMA